MRMQLARAQSLATFVAQIQKRSEIGLIAIIICVIAAMVIPLPHALLDVMVAFNIVCGVALVFMAVYIPAPTAFATFPSVLLVTTLFRLSVSVATTRAILLDADAGKIIETFGNSVAGGNVIVGIVMFCIMTVVQFLVVAKGAERVAEVAARFTLDAMPGKQLSIDSDLRSGLIDKDEARRKRKMLELESQLHGSLDGALKFVKNDAIASIIIVIVNIFAGIALGVFYHDMTISDAGRTYSILTIGEGMVAQVPALFAAFSAGMIVTRTTSEDEGNLGQAISGQLFAQPKVFLGTGLIAILMMAVPGFPTLVFAFFAAILILFAYVLQPSLFNPLLNRVGLKKFSGNEVETRATAAAKENASQALAPPLLLQISADLVADCPQDDLRKRLLEARDKLYAEMGVAVPEVAVVVSGEVKSRQYRLMLFDVPVAQGFVPVGYSLRPNQIQSKLSRDMLYLAAPAENGAAGDSSQPSAAPPDTPLGVWVASAGSNQGAALGSGTSAQPVNDDPLLSLVSGSALVVFHVQLAVKKHLGSFLGIQEVNQLLTRMASQYPDLVKESLRILPLQRIADVLRRLIEEDISVRNLRDILESLVEWGSREKDIVMLAEYVRHGLKRYLTDKYAGPTRSMRALLLHPEVEEHFRRALQASNLGTILALDPETAQRFVQSLRATVAEAATPRLVLLTAMDIRRYVRKLIEVEFSALPVVAYGELESDVRVEPVGNVFL
jgi:type III secretion protein V